MPLSRSVQGSVFFVVSFPSGWPLLQAGVLFQRNQDFISITAYAGIDGRICVALVDQAFGEKVERVFQPFHLTTGTRVVIYVGWHGDDVECQINACKLLPDVDRHLAGISIKGKGEIRLPRMLLYPRIRAGDAMGERDRFFLETVRDLDEKLCVPNAYSLVRAAALLRQMLLDKLIHDVNDAYRCKILFEVYVPPQPVPIQPTLHISSIDPASHPNRQYKSLKLDSFLSLVVVAPSLNVRHIVKTCANAKGGVHLGAARDDFERDVLKMDQHLLLGGQEPSLNLLAEIGNVTLRSLRPLIEAVQAPRVRVPRLEMPTFDGSRPPYRVADRSLYWLGTTTRS